MTLRMIAGLFKGRYLKTPKTNTTRPTQGMLREAVFNICQNEIEDIRFLDLFAGSGAMAFEALSRGAAFAVLVEKNSAAIQCIKENINILNVSSQCRLITQPAQKAIQLLANEGEKFDMIYIDPPYGTPFDLDILKPLLSPLGRIYVEERRDPKNEKSLCKTTLLQLRDARKFGIALLSIFESGAAK